MLYERIRKAQKNMESEKERNVLSELPDGVEEDVVIGRNYIEDNSKYDDRERPDLGPCIPRKDPESPNDLDPDSDVMSKDDLEDPKELENLVESELKKDLETNVVVSENSTYKVAEGNTVTISEKEESMDRIGELERDIDGEDTSGANPSEVFKFLEKYADGSEVLQILRRDLMKILSDVHWILESENQNEQWALDFADALNELSVKI